MTQKKYLENITYTKENLRYSFKNSSIKRKKTGKEKTKENNAFYKSILISLHDNYI